MECSQNIAGYVRVSLPISESLFTQATDEQMYGVARVILMCAWPCARTRETRASVMCSPLQQPTYALVPEPPEFSNSLAML